MFILVLILLFSEDQCLKAFFLDKIRRPILNLFTLDEHLLCNYNGPGIFHTKNATGKILQSNSLLLRSCSSRGELINKYIISQARKCAMKKNKAGSGHKV